MAEERLTPEQVPQLVGLGVEVGDDSGLEPANLQFCLEAVFLHPP